MRLIHTNHCFHVQITFHITEIQYLLQYQKKCVLDNIKMKKKFLAKKRGAKNIKKRKKCFSKYFEE